MSVSLLAALVLSSGVGFDQPFDRTSTVTAATVAQRQLAVSQTKQEIAQRRLSSLTKLLSMGHASNAEVLSAKAAAEIATARLEADKEFLEIAEAASTSQATQLVSGADSVLLKIPGLAGADDQALDCVSSLLVPVNEQWTVIVDGLPQPAASRTRSAAWGELLTRVSSAADGVAGANEQESIRLRHELAIAEEDLASSEFQPLQISRAIKELRLSGKVFRSEAQLSVFLNARHRQTSSQAEQQSMNAVLGQLSTLAERTRAIAPFDAVFANEHQTIAGRISHIKNRLESLTKNEVLIPSGSVVVSYASRKSLPPFVETPTSNQLDAAYQATRRLVDTAHRQTIALRAAFRKVESHGNRIKELAANDSFFAGEARLAELDIEIAKTAWEHSESVLAQRRAELEFVNAVKNCSATSTEDLATDWGTPLVRIFELQASTATAEQAIRANIAKYENVHNAYRELHQAGFASWKEMTGAKVRLSDAQNQLDRVQLEGETYREIYETVKSLEGLQSPVVATID